MRGSPSCSRKRAMSSPRPPRRFVRDSFWLTALAALAALNALAKQDIRERLAYSTIAQAAAVTAGAMLAMPAATYAAILQLVAYCFATLALIIAFANVRAVAERTQIADMQGLGRQMPWTFSAVAIGAVSIIGLPPLAGA